jgi:hypothetical protein
MQSGRTTRTDVLRVAPVRPCAARTVAIAPRIANIPLRGRKLRVGSDPRDDALVDRFRQEGDRHVNVRPVHATKVREDGVPKVDLRFRGRSTLG